MQYISKIYRGKEYGYGISKAEFSPKFKWFKNKLVRLGLGFQGSQDMYETKKTYLLFKRKRVKKAHDNSLTSKKYKLTKDNHVFAWNIL